VPEQKRDPAKTKENPCQRSTTEIDHNILPPFLNISHIVFGTEIKECIFRKKYTMFG
jgi:hypothetical protein